MADVRHDVLVLGSCIMDFTWLVYQEKIFVVDFMTFFIVCGCFIESKFPIQIIHVVTEFFFVSLIMINDNIPRCFVCVSHGFFCLFIYSYSNRLPKRGETIKGTKFETGYGGKCFDCANVNFMLFGG